MKYKRLANLNSQMLNQLKGYMGSLSPEEAAEARREIDAIKQVVYEELTMLGGDVELYSRKAERILARAGIA